MSDPIRVPMCVNVLRMYSVRSTSRTGNGYDRSNIKTHRKQKTVRATITRIPGAWDWKMEDVSGDMTGGKDKDRRGKSEI